MNPLLPVKKVTIDDADLKEVAEPPEPPYVTGGPPFPAHPTDDGKYGISILDYFAAHVIQGLAACEAYTIDDLKNSGAQDAYWIAALMVQLRGNLPITPTPVPVNPPEESGPPLVMPPDNLP